MAATRFALFLWCFTAAQTVLLGKEPNPCLACDRQMRKTFEAIQSWRRLYNGSYPARLVDLETAGLLPNQGATCPELLRGSSRSSAKHNEFTSRGPRCDPEGTYMYEYEMSDCVIKSLDDRPWLPDGAPDYSEQKIKSTLLQRAFFEQVPILRCTSHPNVAPARFSDPRRNLTVKGNVYWSGLYWELLWLDDVPYCARDANVLFGLKGPPFYTNKAPTLDSALDLRKWSCSFGDRAWWWRLPMFEEGRGHQTAPHLRPFFQEDHGRGRNFNGEEWWINGLVQLQGRVGDNIYEEPGMEAFVWKKTNAVVGRTFGRASWLQGTVWTASPGETNGWLVWHYADGEIQRVPIIYGRTTARFWGEQGQIDGEKDFPEPVWRFHEDKKDVGRDRWLRIYRQEWINPRPETTVTSLDFVSNRESRAAPFLIAVNVYP